VQLRNDRLEEPVVVGAATGGASAPRHDRGEPLADVSMSKRPSSPWSWIPTLYFGSSLPYAVVMTLSATMYLSLGISKSEMALYTSWLYLPWVIKPLWSPLVDMFRTKRFWIVTLQLLIGAALAMVALTIPASNFFRLTLACFWLMAFSSATHDIAADGFYLLALPQHQQAAFVGVRSTFYRLANIAVQGGLVALAGKIGERTGNARAAWSITFTILAALFVFKFVYHRFVLPTPDADHSVSGNGAFVRTFVSFFQKKGIGLFLAVLLLYRLAEAQALKLVQAFLLDSADKGGLGLSLTQLGFVYGFVGVVALTLGGILGGLAISRDGLKRWIWPMLLTMHIPILAFVYLAVFQPRGIATISIAIAVEQFGYGFGFTAYMLFMIMVADGPQKTAHYAICTGFMALGMMLPGMVSGYIQEHLGYTKFFFWVLASTIPSLVITALVKIDPAFGKKVST
jgi:PAT family beta-lactamase induction signal transducer AmpG